ncbi:two-component sensor histidine kinase [Kribbella capetownensis]|uniref:Two-component sensor histidine kinase n=1 Tax=Kribbella capetownensis TaxID=1572659 RepID=A0A4R0JEW3_9ACTN|nr:two-component sensor histidine kinase [Kribbella capetownensis]
MPCSSIGTGARTASRTRQKPRTSRGFRSVFAAFEAVVDMSNSFENALPSALDTSASGRTGPSRQVHGSRPDPEILLGAMGACPYPPVGSRTDDEPVSTTSARTGLADRRLRSVALAVLAVAWAQTVITVVGAAASGLSWTRLIDLFVVTNALIGICLASTGWPIANRHPRNLVGWSLLAGGLFYGSTACGTSVLAWLGESSTFWRWFATLTNGGWTWTLATFLPLSLVLFPDGRLPSRRWRWVVVVLVVTGVTWTASAVLDPKGGLTSELGIPGYPAWSGFGQIVWLQNASSIGLAVGYLSAPAAVVVRYRRGSEQTRRQILWLLLATILMVGCFVVASAAGSESLLIGVLPILLVPVAIAIAILRYQLLDIRLVVSRSLLYLLLTGGVVAGYLALVLLLDRTVRHQVSLNSSVLATLVIALAFNPVRVWLQRLIHRAFYGARKDPVRAMAEVGARLGTAAGSGLDGVLEALCRVMRFPAAAVVVDGNQVSAHSELPAVRHAIELRSGSERLGELVVGLRSGEQRLAPADERVLTLLAAPLAVAVQARRLADQLRDSRERVISGREEERRRIRRDLHDGLGPVLTAVVLNADAALRLLDRDRERSSVLLVSLRDLTIGAVEEIRRLVDQLRPPALDGLGLLGALREYAVTAGRRSDGGPLGITVDAPPEVGELPAAVEVATYRIVTEALTNVIRHSNATSAGVRLSVQNRRLSMEVRDNGVNDGPEWQPGVGLTSITERAAELGGECDIRYDRTGCTVSVVLPLGPSVLEVRA